MVILWNQGIPEHLTPPLVFERFTLDLVKIWLAAGAKKIGFLDPKMRISKGETAILGSPK